MTQADVQERLALGAWGLRAARPEALQEAQQALEDVLAGRELHWAAPVVWEAAAAVLRGLGPLE